MKGWILDVVVCAGCGGRLRVVPRAPLLTCRRCEATYPVLGDAPVVVPSPPEYLAGYRDAALATLAERGKATRAAVAVIDAFAQAGPRSEPLAFGDDWVGDEAAAPAGPAGEGAAAATFTRFLAEAQGGVDDAIVAALPRHPRTVIELGAGAGVLARRLAATTGVQRLVVADLSLRAALRATQHAGGRRRAEVAAAVLDAEHLPLAARTVDAIVAAELVDLLAAPERLLAAAAIALRPRGRLILATPDPSLGSGDPARLRALLARGRWRIVDHQPAVPWVRPHGPRHYQVYFADVITAQR